MAGVGGTVHLVVLPNAEKFHTQLKEKVESASKRVKAEVLVDPDMSKFHMELERAERRIDELDGRRVQLYLDVNDDFATRAVEDFIRDAEKESVTKRLLMDTSEARGKMDNFRRDQVDDPIKSFLQVDRFHADEEMDDFRQKQADKTVKQKVVLEFDKFRDPVTGGSGVGGSRASKRLMGVRNDVSAEAGVLDAVNFLPRMLRNINSQLDTGVRQIYDSYFNLFSKLYKFTSKPFIDFQRMAREAKTLGEFFSGTLRPLKKIHEGTKSIFSAIPKGLRAVRRGSAAILRGLKQVPALLKEIVSLVTVPVRAAIRGVKSLVSLFGPGLVSALGKVRGGFVRLGNTLAGGFVNSINFARIQLSSLASGFVTALRTMSSGPLMGKITGFIGALSSGAMRGMSALGRGSKTLLGGIMGSINMEGIMAQFSGVTKFAIESGRLMRHAFESLTPKMMKVLSSPISGLAGALREGLGAVGDYAKAAFSKIGDLTLGLRIGITRQFRGMARGIQGLFGKLVYGARSAFARVSNFASGLVAGVRSVFSRMSRFATGFVMGLTRQFRAMTPILRKTFRGISSMVGKVMGATLNNPALYRGIQAVFRRISTAAMGFSRILMGMFGKIAGVLLKSLLPALISVGVGVMALGGQAAVGAVMALAGAISAVTAGAALMLPAVLGAAAVAFGVLKMGLADVKGSLSAALSADTVEEFEEAIADAHPTVQNLARAMREFKPAIDAMKDTVQGNMLAGLDVGLRNTMNNLLPIFSEGAAKVATSWNRSLGGVLDELSSERAASGLTAIMKGTEEMSIAMEPTLKNLVAAFGSLAEQGAKFLGPLGGWINGLSESFFGWAEGLKEIDETTGISKFDTAIESARVNAGYLGEIFGGLFGTLSNVLQASAEGGAGLLGGMGEGLRGLQEATEKGTEGYASIVNFMESASAAASSLRQIMGPLLVSIMSVGAILTDVAEGAMPGIAGALTGLQIGLQELEPFATAFGEAMGGVIEAFAPLLAALGAALGPVLVGLAEGLNKVFEPMKVGGPFDGFYAKMVELGPVLGNTLLVVGEALGKIFGALAPIMESALGLFEPLLPVFDLFAYWVGEIVVALLEMIEPFMLMRDDAIAGLLDALMPLVEVIGQGLLGVIKAISPLMPMLAGAFASIVEAVTPLIAPLTVLADRLFSALAEAIEMVIPIIPPLIDLIIDLVTFIAEHAIDIVNTLIDVWDKAWPHISKILEFAVNEIIIPLVEWLAEKIVWLSGVLTNIYQNYISPTLDALGTLFGKILEGIVWVIDNIAKPGLDRLKDIFGKTVDGIKSIWEGLKKIFAVPIRFFIETVLNNGLIRGWNWIGPKIGLGEIDDISLGDLGSYHQGGVLAGHSPGRDNYNFIDPKTGTRIGLAGGEAIMRPEWTAAVGGPKEVAKLNDAARHGRIKRNESGHHQGGVVNLGNFAQGGTLQKNPNVTLTTAIQRSMEAAVAAAFPRQIITSATRYQDVGSGYDNHMAGRALDFAADHSLAQWIAQTYPNSAELFWDPGPNIKNGNPIGAIGGHSDHVHWAMSSMVDPYTGEVVSQDGPGGGGGNGFSMIRSLFDKIVSSTLDPIKDAITSKFSDNPFGLEALGGAAKTMIQGFKDFILSKIPLGGGGGSSDWDVSAGAEQWRSMMIDAYKRQGYDYNDAKIDAWIRQIDSESGGDPNIAQQIVDMNGTGEAAGVGLGQIIPATWAAYRDPELPDNRRDPWAMTNAMVRYGERKYGASLLNVIGHGHGYDEGGEAGGIGLLKKMTIEPERVLSPVQTRAFNDFVYGFMPELARQFRNNPLDMQRHFARLTGEVSRIHHELREGHISRMTGYMHAEFRRRADGETLADNPVDMRFDAGWFQRNQENLVENLGRTTRRIGDAIADPDAYLEAEARARKQLEEEFEAAKEKAEAEAREAEAEAREAEEKAEKAEAEAKEAEEKVEAAEDEVKVAEDEARREKEEAEDEAAASDEEREALKEQREEEAEARKEVADAEAEAARQRAQEEEARIEAAKADGSFYYGYKTFDAEGGNPNASEISNEEGAFRAFMDSVGERTGLGPTVSGVAKRFDMVRSIGEAAQTATPAWIAALNGDPSGLAYNVAVGTAQVRKNAVSGFQDLGPSALAGVLEMAISGSSSNSAPFIGEVNTGLSEAQLIQTLEHYEGVRARKGTGTTRVR